MTHDGCYAHVHWEVHWCCCHVFHSTFGRNRYLLGLNGAAAHALPECAARGGYPCHALGQPWGGRSSVLLVMVQVPG